MRRIRHVAAAALAVAVAATAAQGAKKSKDQFWTHPDYATFRIDRVALFPVVSYDNNLSNENQVEASFGPVFKPIGYRWISGSSTRDLMRTATGSDSLLKVVRAQVLAGGRIDSLEAVALAARLRCDAVLTLRIDQFEQYTPEANVAGKPRTTVQLTGALVDAKGRRVWAGSGSKSGEGAYYDPSAGITAVKDTGLQRQGITGQGGAPTYREVLAALFQDWVVRFPPKVAAPDTSSARGAVPAAPDSAKR